MLEGFDSIILLLSSLYIPIYSFSRGCTSSSNGRFYRNPSTIEPLIFSPLSILYILFVFKLVFLSCEYYDLENTKNLAQGLIQIPLSLLNKESLISIFGFNLNSSPNIEYQSLILFFPFYYLVLFVIIPHYVGKYLSVIVQGQDPFFMALKDLRHVWIFEDYVHRNRNWFLRPIYKFFGALKHKDTKYIKLILFFLFSPVGGLFHLLNQTKLAKKILDLVTETSLPEGLEDVYDPNRSVVVDLTLSDKKMLTGILTNVEFEKDKISAFRVENVLRSERREKYVKRIENNESVEVLEYAQRPKQIPGDFMLIRYDSIIDLNVYKVPLDKFLIVSNNLTNIDEVCGKIIKSIEANSKINYVLSNFHICFNVNKIDLSKELNKRLNNKFIFNKLEYWPYKDDDFAKTIKKILKAKEYKGFLEEIR